jgi:hypothetical protein
LVPGIEITGALLPAPIGKPRRDSHSVAYSRFGPHSRNGVTAGWCRDPKLNSTRLPASCMGEKPEICRRAWAGIPKRVVTAGWSHNPNLMGALLGAPNRRVCVSAPCLGSVPGAIPSFTAVSGRIEWCHCWLAQSKLNRTHLPASCVRESDESTANLNSALVAASFMGRYKVRLPRSRTARW